MGWRDLLTKEEEAIVTPWMGGRSLHFAGQRYRIVGTIPSEHGWYQFSRNARNATLCATSEAATKILQDVQVGFLVGNRFVPDTTNAAQIDDMWTRQFKPVHLLEPGLGRFTRIEVGTTHHGGSLVFKGLAYPMGPEDEILSAFLEDKSIAHIKHVIPSLQAAFDLESGARRRANERRQALESARREEEERTRLVAALGSGHGRREMAAVDFHSAAEAALAIGGATLLDVHSGREREMVVRYRLDGRRFECICDLRLRIIDAGVCLTDEESGEKGDTYFTLESLPAVIRQAEREGVLVVYRHI